MKAKQMVRKASLAVAALAVVMMVGSVSGAAQFNQEPGSGVVSLYDSEGFGFEISGITGQASNPRVCVKLVNKATDRRAEGCGPVGVAVHPLLDRARVSGTIEGRLVQASSGRVLRREAPIKVELEYDAWGFYEPLVTRTGSNLWLYPLDVAASQGAGIARAAWGKGAVTAPVCTKATTSPVALRRRGGRGATAPVMCGVSSSAPAFAGMIAQTFVASVGVAN